MTVLTKVGRIALAKALKNETLFLAWGSGEEHWGQEPPAEEVGATTLVKEIGRRKLTQVHFLKPDEEGDIIIMQAAGDDGFEKLKYSISEEPTNILLFRAPFDFGDAASAVIREIGIFAGGTTQEGLPEGQRYFTAEQVTDLGRLLAVENIQPIYRSAATREQFDFVLTL